MNAYFPQNLTLEALRENPAPDFIQRDVEALSAQYVAKFEELTGRTLYPAQTEMYVLEVMAYAKSIMAEAIQAAFMQNRAIWATGRHLDELGANVSTFRLAAQVAVSRVRFTLSQSRPSSVVIASGTRVSAGDDYIFSTAEALVIPAGALTGDVDIIAAGSGVDFNGFELGQIREILDPIAYISSVENVVVSGGGSNIESDDRYRLRIVNALERISKAGPREGYIEHVKAVNPAIVDVDVIRPQPGYIEITPLMVDGVSSDAIDAAIIDHLDPETLIPMGDYVSIVKASNQVFDIVLNVRISSVSNGLETRIEQAVRNRFSQWTKTLGAQVAPSAILAAVKAIAGVVDVTSEGFDYRDLAATQFATLNDLTINLIEVPNV